MSMLKLTGMMKSDADKDIVNFPLAINLDGEELWLMVQTNAFAGGKFYIVRGKGITPLHIMGVSWEEGESEKLDFTVMNDDTSSDAFVAAVLQALRQPFDNDDLPNEEVSDGMPFE